MYTDPVAELLRPKQSNLIKSSDSVGSYRPKSMQSNRSNKNIISQQQQRPPSQQSQIGSNGGKRIVHIGRNGKKIEQIQSIAPAKTTYDLCYEFDPFVLDQISPEDPIWRQILPDNMPLDEQTLEKLLEDNPDYFYHHLGFCACYRCKCGRCRCDVSNQVKLKINGSFLTIYDKDFIPHKSSYNNLTPLNSKTYTTKFLDQKTIDFTTSHQQDYKEMPLQSTESFKPPYRPQLGSMSNLTSYRSNYSNWGNNYQRFSRYPHISTSTDIKFIGKTQYQDSFVPPSSWKVESQNYFKSELSPMPTGPFVGMTTSQQNFQPFKVARSPQKPTHHKYETTPSFDGQFTSTGMKDFTQQQDDYCPAKQFQKIFRKKLAQKVEKKKENFIERRINNAMKV
ncbi:unnamed protein product [Paramecium octaurelia]|uniref:STOP protein n=1 Tax=Paramecium octaurelia TaxID=43137 RepID=A0A8S1UVU2_PAROT|nr:unnamed protein product [Paramecium octaurelia]